MFSQDDKNIVKNNYPGQPIKNMIDEAVKTSGRVTWSGGLDTLQLALLGVEVGDLVVASISTAPSEAAYLASAVAGNGVIDFTLSAANTSNDAVIDFVVL